MAEAPFGATRNRNRVLPSGATDVYDEKASRWAAHWPRLQVIPWRAERPRPGIGDARYRQLWAQRMGLPLATPMRRASVSPFKAATSVEQLWTQRSDGTFDFSSLGRCAPQGESHENAMDDRHRRPYSLRDRSFVGHERRPHHCRVDLAENVAGLEESRLEVTDGFAVCSLYDSPSEDVVW